MVPRREALLGSTLETRNTSSRPARDRLRDHALGVAIHLGGVDMGHADVEAAAQRRDGGLAVAVVEIPGALPDYGNFRAMRAEFFLFQDHLNF